MKKYLINHDWYFTTGTTPEGLVIFGFFDKEGSFIESTRIHTPEPKEIMIGSFEKRQAWKKEKLGKVAEQFKVTKGPIKVQKFYWPDWSMGIEDLPSHYREFLADPNDGFDDEDRENYPKYIKNWQDEDQYVFWWGNDYYMDGDGEVESS